MKKRTEVMIRTRQRLLVRALRVRCQQCGAEVPLVSPQDAAGVLRTTAHEIHGLLASGDLHAVSEPSGASLICGNFLSATSESEPGAVATGPSTIKGERQ